MYFPKFHCELNAIERVWYHSKKHKRAYVNGSIVRLHRLVPEGLDNVTTDMIKRICREYEKAYWQGLSGKDVESRVNTSHTGVLVKDIGSIPYLNCRHIVHNC